MKKLFEESNTLVSPIECFVFDSQKEVFPVKPHWHYFMEIIYMLKGRLKIYSDNNVYYLNTDDIIVIHSKAIHSIYADSGEPPLYAVIKFDINRLRLTTEYSPKMSLLFNTARNSEKANIYIPSEDTKVLDVKNIFKSCLSEMHRKDYGYDMLLNALLYILLMKILRYWRNRGFDTTKIKKVQNENESIHTISEYIDMHSAEPLKVEKIAEKCGMSYSYFAKRFKELYGQSCKDFIEYIRVSKAEDFLIFTDCDLNYISQETGFSDCSHLIKVFKACKGVTPKQFRKNNRIRT
ncbi:AraC-like DNA-binding protein [Ruminiclostridium sufflavum DSM 19573]|uniref:AraC-like DNA-binding protein n=1 Tax=Ruminiclostridium sufflavum DSM 19573 TaxID=1121337 RepID=A0A318XNS1_9FIRM|nr:AraC family transcriptional regulator [Ruminiclostridium sufflavum]PYG87652.1 AraC-like DNA-binding protein [Ruminiclostridium sufflavum DSM 19573]